MRHDNISQCITAYVGIFRLPHCMNISIHFRLIHQSFQQNSDARRKIRAVMYWKQFLIRQLNDTHLWKLYVSIQIRKNANFWVFAAKVTCLITPATYETLIMFCIAVVQQSLICYSVQILVGSWINLDCFWDNRKFRHWFYNVSQSKYASLNFGWEWYNLIETE